MVERDVVIKDSVADNRVHASQSQAFNYETDKEPRSGFQMAVNNGQTRLALEYAVNLLNEYETRISALEAAVERLSRPTTTRAAASTKKQESDSAS